jgi:hypothetical protein
MVRHRRKRWHRDEDVQKCRLCGGDPAKRDNFKDSALRLKAPVTARSTKRN